MPNPNSPYRVIAVAPHRTVETQVKNAPDAVKMTKFGALHDAEFVVRYYPRHKGWQVLDIRRRRLQATFVGQKIWDYRSVNRVGPTFKSEDAAVMWAMHHTGIEIAQ